MQHHPTIIIGAGAAGLTCAKYLNDRQIPCTILEAGDAVGGRVRTDSVDGFQMDRGFQILLTSYPETKRLLNYPALQLRAFRSGAVIRWKNTFATLTNPLKELLAVIPAGLSPVGSLPDKLRVLQLARHVWKIPQEAYFSQPDTSTAEFLRSFKFSEKFLHHFFFPFFAGVFLEKELLTSANFFRFVFRHFAQGDAMLPERGMQAIPEQLAAMLPPDCVKLNVRVKAVREGNVYVENGEVLSPQRVIVAADANAAANLLNESVATAWHQTVNVYFSASRSPLSKPMLVLNPNQDQLVNNICVPSDIAPSYAPPGKSLISVSIVGEPALSDAEMVSKVRQELSGWYGAEVNAWQLLKVYRIPHALPNYTVTTPKNNPLNLQENLYRCGDYLAYPSLNAAMQTGREVAEMIGSL